MYKTVSIYTPKADEKNGLEGQLFCLHNNLLIGHN